MVEQSFLVLQSPEHWPATSFQVHSNIPEARVFITLSTDSQPTFSSWWQFRGDYTSLLHLTAWIRCFQCHCHQPLQRCTPHCLLQPDEIEDARLYLLLLAQRELFPDELRQLRKGEAVANKSKLLCLSPMLDKDCRRLTLTLWSAFTDQAFDTLVERLIRHSQLQRPSRSFSSTFTPESPLLHHRRETPLQGNQSPLHHLSTCLC